MVNPSKYTEGQATQIICLHMHCFIRKKEKNKSLSFTILKIINHDAHLEECQVYIPYETVQNTQTVNYLYFHMESYSHMLSVIPKR